MSVEKYFAADITVRTVTRTSNSMGGWTEGNSDTTISGCIRKLSGTRQIAADKDSPYATHRLYCYPTTSITINSRIVHGSDVYRVLLINDVMELGKLMQVDLEVGTRG